MKKSFVLGVLAVGLVFVLSSWAYPWGYATHAYYAHVLNKKDHSRDLNEVYAGMAPDLFNFRFELPVYGPDGLYYWLHYGHDLLWDEKETGMAKGLGYGFASHNDAWGADFTAHHSGRTHGVEEGYVIAKAHELGEAAPVLSAIVGPAVAMDLQHTFVEYAVDILMKRLDPEIGPRIVASAARRNPEFPSLLIAAYAEQFDASLPLPDDAAEIILAVEADFNASMLAYGQILTLDETGARQAISLYLAGFAEEYLATNGVELPIPADQLPWMIDFYVALAMQLCETDLPVEIAATTDYVDEQMAIRKIGNQR